MDKGVFDRTHVRSAKRGTAMAAFVVKTWPAKKTRDNIEKCNGQAYGTQHRSVLRDRKTYKSQNENKDVQTEKTSETRAGMISEVSIEWRE